MVSTSPRSSDQSQAGTGSERGAHDVLTDNDDIDREVNPDDYVIHQTFTNDFNDIDCKFKRTCCTSGSFDCEHGIPAYHPPDNIDPGDVLPQSPFWVHQALKGFTSCEKMDKLAITLQPLVQDMINDRVPQIMGAILQRPYTQLVNLCCNRSKLRSVVFYTYLSMTSNRTITEHDVRKGRVTSHEQGIPIRESTGKPLLDARGTCSPPTSTWGDAYLQSLPTDLQLTQQIV